MPKVRSAVIVAVVAVVAVQEGRQPFDDCRIISGYILEFEFCQYEGDDLSDDYRLEILRVITKRDGNFAGEIGLPLPT